MSRQIQRIKQSLNNVTEFANSLEISLIGLADNVNYGDISHYTDIVDLVDKIQSKHYETTMLIDSLKKNFAHTNLKL